MKMDKYINEETLIKTETFYKHTDQIICQICSCIIIDPVMCLNCQNHYCKQCIEDWQKKKNICPNLCEEPIFKKVIEKNRLIKDMKFRCIKGCGAEIPFDDIEKHYSSNCLENKDKKNKEDDNKNLKKNDDNSSNIRALSKKEVLELKKNDKNIKYFTSN